MSFLNVTKSSSAISCSYTALLISGLSFDASRASINSSTVTPTSARLLQHRVSTYPLQLVIYSKIHTRVGDTEKQPS